MIGTTRGWPPILRAPLAQVNSCVRCSLRPGCAKPFPFGVKPRASGKAPRARILVHAEKSHSRIVSHLQEQPAEAFLSVPAPLCEPFRCPLPSALQSRARKRPEHVARQPCRRPRGTVGAPDSFPAPPNRQPGPHGLPDQLALELRNAGEDAEHQPAIRGRIVHPLVEQDNRGRFWEGTSVNSLKGLAPGPGLEPG